MADMYAVSGETLTCIADAIRSKTGSDEMMPVAAMASAIEGISGGFSLKPLERDFNGITKDFYLRNGEEISYKGWDISEYIKVPPGGLVINFENVTNIIKNEYCATYNADKILHSKQMEHPGHMSLYRFDDAVKYIRVSSAANTIASFTIYAL